MLWLLSCFLVLRDALTDLHQGPQVFASVSLEAYLSP